MQLKELLMKRWEEAKKKKVFNYDLNCMYKLLPGDYNFSIQVAHFHLRQFDCYDANIQLLMALPRMFTISFYCSQESFYCSALIDE